MCVQVFASLLYSFPSIVLKREYGEMLETSITGHYETDRIFS